MEPSPIAPDPELLLAHAGFVRSLARALLSRDRAGDDGLVDVDDVVQQTWLTALTKPPRDLGAIRAWLARVVRSRVRETRRGEERRGRRERAASRPELVADADPARAAERLAVLRDVVDAVLALDEPARSVVLARYLEERAPTQIAARERVPVATIETRLRRAREQLRVRLDARHRDERAAFLAALVGLAGGPRAVAATVAPAAVAAWAGIAAIVALVTWMSWITWSSRSSAPRPASNAGEVASAAATDENESVAPVRSVEAGAGAAATGGATVRLRVIAKESGKPLAGATVRFVEAPADPRERVRVAWLEEALTRDRLFDEHRFMDGDWYLERQRALEAKAMREGRVFTCDRNGEVALPSFGVALVAVRSGEFATAGWIERGDKEQIPFEVEREVALRIEVVDRSGRPQADVPVMLAHRMTEKGRPTWRLAEWRGTTHGATPGPVGIAEIPGGEIAGLREMTRASGRATFVVALGLADTEETSVPVDLADLPSRPIRLTLPPTGRLRIRLTTPDGAALLAPARIGLAPAVRNPVFESPNVARYWQHAEQGSIEIDRVGIDRDFSLWLAVDDDSRQPSITTISGPKREDETAEVVVAAGPPIAVVTGRLLTPDGEPLRDWPVRAKYDITMNPHERTVETDEEGSFRLGFTVWSFEYWEGHGWEGLGYGAGSQTSRELMLTPIHGAELDASVGTLAITRKLTKEELGPGVHDLGDLQLENASVIVAGRVVDTDHRPRADVDLDVVRWLEGYFHRNVFPGIRGRTRADGSFSIPGAPIATRLQIEARGDDCFLADPLEFACGARNLEIVVEKAGELRGTILVDPGVRLDDVTLDPSDDFVTYGAWNRDRGDLVSIGADGRFRVARLHAGRGALTVALGRSNFGRRDLYETIETIPDLEVAAGSVCTDPRVQTIDLRGKLRPLEITVRDEAGSALALAFVRVAPEPSDESELSPRSATTGPDGVARHVGFAATYRVAVEKEGFETTTLRDVPSSREVVLHPKR